MPPGPVVTVGSARRGALFEMNRNTYLVIALAAAAVLLVSTGAFDTVGIGDGAEAADIELSPAAGPNGGYAALDENGEIELLLSEANSAVEGSIVDDAVTPLDDVFTVTYRGDRYADVWFSVDAESVGFYLAGDPSRRLDGEADSVRIGSNETVSVGILVDTSGDHDAESVDSFTVHAIEPDAADLDRSTPTGTDVPTPTDGRTTVTPSPTPTGTSSPTATVEPTPTESRTETVAPIGTDEPSETAMPAGTDPPSDSSTPTSTTDATASPGTGPGSVVSTVAPPSQAPTERPAAEDAPRPIEAGGSDPTVLAYAVAGLVALAGSLLAWRWYR